MRKLLSSGLVVFAGVMSAPESVSIAQTFAVGLADYRHDPRLASLQNFFGRRCDCPAAQLSHVFLEAADGYNLDWRLLPSISFVESTGGKRARNNNLFGWDNGRAEFPSMTASIHAVGYRLANSERYKDKNIDELLATYNPHLDYVQKVKSIMRRIAPE